MGSMGMFGARQLRGLVKPPIGGDEPEMPGDMDNESDEVVVHPSHPSIGQDFAEAFNAGGPHNFQPPPPAWVGRTDDGTQNVANLAPTPGGYESAHALRNLVFPNEGALAAEHAKSEAESQDFFTPGQTAMRGAKSADALRAIDAQYGAPERARAANNLDVANVQGATARDVEGMRANATVAAAGARGPAGGGAGNAADKIAAGLMQTIIKNGVIDQSTGARRPLNEQELKQLYDEYGYDPQTGGGPGAGHPGNVLTMADLQAYMQQTGASEAQARAHAQTLGYTVR